MREGRTRGSTLRTTASLALVGALVAACSSGKTSSQAQSPSSLPVVATPSTTAAPPTTPPPPPTTTTTTITPFLRPASQRSADPSVPPLPGELAPLPTQPPDPPDLAGKIGLPVGRSDLITFYFLLPTDDATLVTAVKALTTPGTASYRHYLTSYADAARAYGANPNDIEAAVHSVEAKGMSAVVDPSRTFVRVLGTAAQWATVSGAPLILGKAADGGPFSYYSLQAVPTFDKLTYVGAGGANYQSAADNGTRRSGASAQNASIINQRTDLNAKPAAGSFRPAAWPANDGSHAPNTCVAGSSQAANVYSPDQLATAYKAAPAAESPATNATRVGVISLGGGFSASDIQAAAACFGYKPPNIQVMAGDGINGSINNNDEETELDLQTMAANLPGATIQLIEAGNAPASLLDATSRMFGDPNGFPDGGSISYAQCAVPEKQSTAELMNAIARVILVGMTVGSSIFVAAGDWGSAMCPDSVQGTSQAFAASAPWATAIGGTRLTVTPDNQRSDEVVWNDSAYGVQAATGGGVSKVFKRPYYQDAVTQEPTRVVPDFSALAALVPGWPIVLNGQLQSIGGTSGSTPFGMAKLALLSAKERLAGRPRVGFVNPWLYQLYQQHPEAFYDVTQGTNDLDGVGCCTAGPGFDEVSGLGVPTGDITAYLPPPAP